MPDLPPPRTLTTLDLGAGPVAVEVVHAHRHPDGPQGGPRVGMPPLWVRVGGGPWVCAGRVDTLSLRVAVELLASLSGRELDSVTAAARAVSGYVEWVTEESGRA